MACMSLYASKLTLMNIWRGFTQEKKNPVKHHITALKMFISRHVIFALVLVCSAFKHSGLDTQASWYEDIYYPGSIFLPKTWI